MKLKHGDKITCKICGTKITNARISIEKDSNGDTYFYICQNQKPGAIAQNQLGYKYSYYVGNYRSMETDYKIKKIKTKIEQIKEILNKS